MSVLPHEGTYNILYGTFGVPVGAGFRRGYLARPDRAGEFPLVMVVHDIFGLTSHEKDVCRALARRGFAALAVDLYGNAAPARRANLDEAIAAYGELEDRRALADLDEAHEFAMSDDVPWVIKAPIGLLGLDIGGRYALLYAATRPDVAAVAAVSAPLAGDEEREHQVGDALGRLRVPVLGLYGAEDELVPAESVDTAQQINASGRWLLYEGAGHEFFNVGESGYHGGAAADATARLAGFFESTLVAPHLEEVG